MQPELQSPAAAANIYPDDIDSACSTPYVSAPSSPCHGQPLSCYYYSAPTSPMHFVLSTTCSNTSQGEVSSSASASAFEFDFSAYKLNTDGATSPGSSMATMSSADELFLNGQIRPTMKLSTHLPLEDNNDQELVGKGHDHDCVSRCRDDNVKFRDKPLMRRRTRSLSPLRTAPFDWQQDCENDDDEIVSVVVQNEAKQNDHDHADADAEEELTSTEATPCDSGTSSRSSSVGRSSKRWVFLKEFLYRSKSEGRNNGNNNKYFWNGLSTSSFKDNAKKMEKMKTQPTMKKPSSDEKSAALTTTTLSSTSSSSDRRQQIKKRVVMMNGKAVNYNGGVMRKRRVPPSAHELHYTANRAQAEEMRKKTFLPYRQGLLGCLGFSSKSYGAWNGFTRALNPVSSR